MDVHGRRYPPSKLLNSLFKLWCQFQLGNTFRVWYQGILSPSCIQLGEKRQDPGRGFDRGTIPNASKWKQTGTNVCELFARNTNLLLCSFLMFEAQAG